MFIKVSSAGAKADSDMLPIAPTSSRTIGNTLVGGWASVLRNVSVSHVTFSLNNLL